MKNKYTDPSEYTEYLDEVNENDEVVGKILKKDAHEQKVLHRHVHVWVVVDGVLHVQIRNSGIIDATAGGHVTCGMSYKEAAVMELEEEMGLKISESSLLFVNKLRTSQKYKTKPGFYNEVFTTSYAYYAKKDETLVPNLEEVGGIMALTREDYEQMKENNDERLLLDEYMDIPAIFDFIENRQ